MTPSLPRVLREHRQRIGQSEAPSPGQWVYVLPIAPASPPVDLVPGDPLAPSFKNGWGNVAGQQPVSFRVHPATKVCMRGVMTGGAFPSIAFTLPAGFRPSLPVAMMFPSSGGAHVYTARVDPNGDVTMLAQVI